MPSTNASSFASASTNRELHEKDLTKPNFVPLLTSSSSLNSGSAAAAVTSSSVTSSSVTSSSVTPSSVTSPSLQLLLPGEESSTAAATVSPHHTKGQWVSTNPYPLSPMPSSSSSPHHEWGGPSLASTAVGGREKRGILGKFLDMFRSPRNHISSRYSCSGSRRHDQPSMIKSNADMRDSKDSCHRQPCPVRLSPTSHSSVALQLPPGFGSVKTPFVKRSGEDTCASEASTEPPTSKSGHPWKYADVIPLTPSSLMVPSPPSFRRNVSSTPSISLHPPPPPTYALHRHCEMEHGSFGYPNRRFVSSSTQVSSPTSPCPVPPPPYLSMSSKTISSPLEPTLLSDPSFSVSSNSSLDPPATKQSFDASPHSSRTFTLSPRSPLSSPRSPTDSLASASAHAVVPHPPAFEWRCAKEEVKRRVVYEEEFSLFDVPFREWKFNKIPTLGASPSSCRVQEMYKSSVTSGHYRVFIKTIPLLVWNRQWDQEAKWNGEFVTDGENFVMEAAVLAYLQAYAPSVAPCLLGVVQLSSPLCQPVPSSGEITHIALVSELYGEDLLDYIDRREKEGKPLTKYEKREIQFSALCCLQRFHYLGLAHLDFTPENLLIGREGLRLCDFAKTTPLYTRHPRHLMGIAEHCVSSPPNSSRYLSTYASTCGLRNMCGPLYVFESCEPTVGKGAYMPPECWRVYWKLEDTKVQYPLSDLRNVCGMEDRKGYYFRVREADTYMLGVLLFWIWADGGIWKCSDLTQDDRYSHLVTSNLNFDLFRECRPWPRPIKELLQKVLCPSPSQRLKLEEVQKHRWWYYELTCSEEAPQKQRSRPISGALSEPKHTAGIREDRRRGAE